ncbi:plasmid segregation protein ParM [Pseudomonas nitritireducens]|uniref:Plasmid segregation protein ParM n=1 Tax=Pseudomonas nitroreducens TaxID=46680 RepID=A0A7W7KF19_PSENT|nr:ParM/StbA family protein [Pseudomonas nitritireducens]MBB4861330.1 plasmid segregation protein ParM [Pseudomonas nitritireducens]
MEQKQVLFAGIDDGHRDTKIVLSNGSRLVIPSRAASGVFNKISISGSTSGNWVYNTEDGPFTVGDIGTSEFTAYDEYPFSAQNRVIVAHALRQFDLPSNVEIHGVSGLPLKRYYIGNTPNKAVISRKRKNLMKGDVAGADGYIPPIISRHDVMSEGIAAWVNQILVRQPSGKLDFDKERVKRRMALIDIGGRTLDIAVIRDWELDGDRSTTEDIGMINIVKDIRERLFHRFEGIEVTDEQVDEALRTGLIRLWGETHDVRALVEEANKAVVNKIRSTIKSCLQKSHDIEQVTFLGGTSQYLERYLQGWFRNQVMAEDPVFENALGMLKFAEYKMGGVAA